MPRHQNKRAYTTALHSLLKQKEENQKQFRVYNQCKTCYWTLVYYGDQDGQLFW